MSAATPECAGASPYQYQADRLKALFDLYQPSVGQIEIETAVPLPKSNISTVAAGHGEDLTPITIRLRRTRDGCQLITRDHSSQTHQVIELLPTDAAKGTFSGNVALEYNSPEASLIPVKFEPAYVATFLDAVTPAFG